jgi:hypothetical protein
MMEEEKVVAVVFVSGEREGERDVNGRVEGCGKRQAVLKWPKRNGKLAISEINQWGRGASQQASKSWRARAGFLIVWRSTT